VQRIRRELHAIVREIIEKFEKTSNRAKPQGWDGVLDGISTGEI
jgi:hypothetical protein